MKQNSDLKVAKGNMHPVPQLGCIRPLLSASSLKASDNPRESVTFAVKMQIPLHPATFANTSLVRALDIAPVVWQQIRPHIPCRLHEWKGETGTLKINEDPQSHMRPVRKRPTALGKKTRTPRTVLKPITNVLGLKGVAITTAQDEHDHTLASRSRKHFDVHD
jgi:hypothetical protein